MCYSWAAFLKIYVPHINQEITPREFFDFLYCCLFLVADRIMYFLRAMIQKRKNLTLLWFWEWIAMISSLSCHTFILQTTEWRCILDCKEEKTYDRSEIKRTKQGPTSLKPPNSQLTVSNSFSEKWHSLKRKKQQDTITFQHSNEESKAYS